MKKVLFTLVTLLVLCLAVSVAFADGIEVDDYGYVQYGELDKVTKVGGHDVVSMELIEKPTCTEPGMVKIYCGQRHAGDTTSSHVIYIYPEGHFWASEQYWTEWGIVVEEPVCNKPGYAIDVCLNCGLTNPEKTRTILADHVYDDDHYRTIYPVSCIEDGWGIHTCIYCGQDNPVDVEDWKTVVETPDYDGLVAGKYHLVRIKMLPHNWTPWNVETEPTCRDYGTAKRACEWCGATQELNDLNPEVVDQGKKYTRDSKELKAIWPLNRNWQTELVDNLHNVEIDSQNELGYRMNQIKTCKYMVVNDWLADCYTRYITVACPYCYGDEHPYHQPVTYTLKYPMVAAHEWVLSEEESVEPTCTEDGVNVYLCKHDNCYEMRDKFPGVKHTHTHPQEMGIGTDPAMLTETVPALGHLWGDWVVADEYLNEKGETVQRLVSTCERCHGTKNEVVNIGEVGKKNGLIKGDDGKWYYFKNDEWQKDYTGFVTFQGGEFWVTEGIVDTSLNGLINCPGDKWLFFAQGQVQKVTKIEYYQGQGFALKNGQLDLSANGLLDFDGGKFAFAAGRLLKEVNGIWQNPKDKVWYFLSQGQLQLYTGTATYDGATFELVNGIVIVK